MKEDFKMFIEIEGKQINILEGLTWFEKGIFYYYNKKKISMRKLSEQTKINIGTIFKTIKKCNLIIKDKYGDIKHLYKYANYE